MLDYYVNFIVSTQAIVQQLTDIRGLVPATSSRPIVAPINRDSEIFIITWLVVETTQGPDPCRHVQADPRRGSVALGPSPLICARALPRYKVTIAPLLLISMRTALAVTLLPQEWWGPKAFISKWQGWRRPRSCLPQLAVRPLSALLLLKLRRLVALSGSPEPSHSGQTGIEMIFRNILQ